MADDFSTFGSAPPTSGLGGGGTPNAPSNWAQQLFASNPFANRYNFTPINFNSTPSIDDNAFVNQSIASQLPSSSGGTSTGPSNGASGGSWVSNLWNGLKQGTENYVLNPLSNIGKTVEAAVVDPFSGRNVYNDIGDIWTNPNYDNPVADKYINSPAQYLVKAGESIPTALFDPFATNGSIGQRLSQTASDLGKLWATPNNTVTKDVVAKEFQGNPILKAIGITPEEMGTGVDLLSSVLSPTGGIASKTLGAAKNVAMPLMKSANTAMRGESGLADAINTARQSAAETQTDAFNTNLQAQQMDEAINSANKGNFNLADMLNRSPQAQNTYINTMNDMAQNAAEPKGKIPDLSFLSKLQQPVTVDNPAFKEMMQGLQQNVKPPMPYLNNADWSPSGYVPQTATETVNKVNPARFTLTNPANTLLQKLFNTAQETGLPAGREYETLQNLLPQISGRSGVNLDTLINQSSRTPQQVLNDALSAARERSLARAAGVESMPTTLKRSIGPITQQTVTKEVPYTPNFQMKFPLTVSDKPTIPAQITKTYGEVKGINPFDKAMQKEANAGYKIGDLVNPVDTHGNLLSEKPIKITGVNELNGVKYYNVEGTKTAFPQEQLQKVFADSKPFQNPLADVLNPTKQAQLASDQVDRAKAMATLDSLVKNAESKNIAQTAYSKAQDTFNKLFNLPGALGGKFGDYYKYLSNKQYQMGQADKDLVDFASQYDPNTFKDFILARDAGEIGQGHPYESMNNAYDALLNKYTGGDVSSGLERGNLQNYVPRIMNVDKGNYQAAKRAMGSESLGGFAEDRTDNRTLRQIIADEGRNPYKDDLIDATRQRLQTSISAQAARDFVDRMVGDGKAVKFDNVNQAFASHLYKDGITGVYVDPITKQTYLLEKPIADFLNKEEEFKQPDSGVFSGLLKGLDAVNSLAKRMTITNPMVHFPHNVLSSIPNALRDAGTSGANVLTPSFWQKGINADPALLDEMERMGVLHPEYKAHGQNASEDIIQAAKTKDMNPIQRYGSDLVHQLKTGAPMDRLNDAINTAARPLDTLTWGPEHAARVAVYKTAKEMGATPEEAAQIINNNFGTNTKTLTPFEKSVMQRFITFYPWLKHVVTAGARNLIENADIVGKTYGTLNQANMDLSGHPMSDNPAGYGLEVDTGHKDANGHEIYTDVYLPQLEFAKFIQNPAQFVYNRSNPTFRVPIDLIANKKYGAMSPIDIPIRNQGRIDAGLENATNDNLAYALQKAIPNPLKPFDDMVNTTDPVRQKLAWVGARSSAYNPDAIAKSNKYRGEQAAISLASQLKKAAQPIPKALKKQMMGTVPFPIAGQ